jgi:hypothetical protein
VTLLGHLPDAAGLAYWQSQLAGGASRDAVARTIWNSPEHRGVEIDQYYQTFLGRSADSGGRAYWVNAFTSWGSERLVVASFLTSAEYQSLHSSDTNYLGALYNDIFSRQPDPSGLAAWLAALQNGSKTRLDAAFAFIDAGESHGRVVDGFFADFFQRTGTTDRQNWVNALDSGALNIEDVVGVHGFKTRAGGVHFQSLARFALEILIVRQLLDRLRLPLSRRLEIAGGGVGRCQRVEINGLLPIRKLACLQGRVQSLHAVPLLIVGACRQ